jgi:ribose 5-phosphate isomerase A
MATIENDARRAAAEAALARLPISGVIGLGTGRTAQFFIEGVAKLVAAGRNLRGVATSRASADQAAALGIPLLSEDGPWAIDVCVDGADEIDPSRNLIKGGGGALLREKIVNQASRLNIIVADAAKLSERLGDHWAIPIEVTRFGHASTAAVLASFGTTTLRRDKGGDVYATDGGNVIYDVRTGPINDPARLDATLRAVPGVVETGLFVARASLVLVGEADGSVRQL